MRGLQFVLSLVFSLMGLIGYLAFDYTMVTRGAKARGEEPMSFVTYLSGMVEIVGLFGGAGDGKAEAGVADASLAAMLPKTPGGWVSRPSEPGDINAFLPPGAKGEAAEKLRAMVEPRPGKGVDTARVTYERGAQKVVIELVRYPDFVFTSFMAMAQKVELQMMTMEMYGGDFATVRGLEIGESRLPETFGGRLFTAQVGSQIHLRILAPKSMSDEEMLPFLNTLNVPAMNASVIERTTGLGEVPIIVLTSVITEETRRSFEAEREAARKAQADEQAAREAEQEAAARGITTDKDTGVKVRKGTGEGSGSTFSTGGTLDDSGCRIEDGRKICGAAEEEAAIQE